MQTKLTLRLEERLIRKAKRYSKKSGKSVSKLVADYFSAIEEEGASKEDLALSPRVRSLFGVLAGGQASEKDYRRHLEEKHL